MKAEKSKAEVWSDKIEKWDGTIVGNHSIFHDVEDDEEAAMLQFRGLDGTVYVFPDGSVAVVQAVENSYGDTEIRDSSVHASLPALVDSLRSRYTELIKDIQAVGDTYESAFESSHA